MRFEDMLKERYEALVELSYNFNSEIDKTKKLLTDLMNAQEFTAEGTIYKPDYQPVLQQEEPHHLLDKVMTDQVSLFDVLESKDITGIGIVDKDGNTIWTDAEEIKNGIGDHTLKYKISQSG